MAPGWQRTKNEGVYSVQSSLASMVRVNEACISVQLVFNEHVVIESLQHELLNPQGIPQRILNGSHITVAVISGLLDTIWSRNQPLAWRHRFHYAECCKFFTPRVFGYVGG